MAWMFILSWCDLTYQGFAPTCKENGIIKTLILLVEGHSIYTQNSLHQIPIQTLQFTPWLCYFQSSACECNIIYYTFYTYNSYKLNAVTQVHIPYWSIARVVLEEYGPDKGLDNTEWTQQGPYRQKTNETWCSLSMVSSKISSLDIMLQKMVR